MGIGRGNSEKEDVSRRAKKNESKARKMSGLYSRFFVKLSCEKQSYSSFLTALFYGKIGFTILITAIDYTAALPPASSKEQNKNIYSIMGNNSWKAI